MTEEKKYTVAEVAKRLGNVSRSLVYAEIDRGRLKAHRYGKGRGAIRITESQLSAYLALTATDTESQQWQSEESTAAGKPTYPTNGEVSRALNALSAPRKKPASGKEPSSNKGTVVSLGCETDAYSGKH